jgi:hypothetical protein
MINGEGGVCSDFAQVYNTYQWLESKRMGLKILNDNPDTLRDIL